MKREFEANWASLDSRKIPGWFQNSKFGIFIHWGVYSVPAWRGTNDKLFGSYAEWYYASVYSDYENHDPGFHEQHFGKDFKYRDFVSDFKADLFDAKKWVQLFKYAGAKYVVLTTKHHEGYCLWPTKNPHKKNWRVTDVGPAFDIVGALSEEVKNQGLRMGFYYSIIEWETNWSHRPKSGYFVPEKDRRLYGMDEAKYAQEILLPQLKELVETYQPSLIFSDGGEWDLSEEYTQTKEFLAWLYNHPAVSDEIVVNDRFFKGMPETHGDYYSTEYNDKGGFLDVHPWEESRGIGKSYGFNRAEDISSYHSFEELIKEMVAIITKGGNFLLNVGPTADGRIPVIQEERLTQIGDWMSINEEAIYDTQTGDKIVRNYPATVKNSAVYVFSFAMNDSVTIQLTENHPVKKVSILGIEDPIQFKQKQQQIKIKLPELAIYQLLNAKNIGFVTYVIKLEL